MDKLLSVGEACKRLGIHPNTLRRWDKEGKIRVVRLQGCKRKIPESEVGRILGTQTVPEKPSEANDLLQSFVNFVFTRCQDDQVLVKKAVMLRDGQKCTRCGGTNDLAVYPPDLKGSPSDLKTLCKSCAEEEYHKEKEEEKTEKEHKKEVITQKEVSRMFLLEKISPSNLLQRTAFGDMLSAAISLRKFSVEQLSAASRCPPQLAALFCDRMSEEGYLRQNADGLYELLVRVIV